QTNCGTIVPGTLNLPAGAVIQRYGAPGSRVTRNGQQYWLYNNQGMLLSLPSLGNVVQGLTVYPAGQYCAVIPTFVTLFGLAINTGNITQCSSVYGPQDHDRTE